MGTNYYMLHNVCPHCGKGESETHIGKSSWGWCFSLHIEPPEITNLDGWKLMFQEPGSVIKSEYDDIVSVNEMLDIITKREEYHKIGRDLLRHEIDGRHCVGHGEGSWDYCVGEFS